MKNMTAIDFERCGVVFGGDGSVSGPKDDKELFAKLKEAIHRRVPAMMYPLGFEERGASRCDICKDAMHIGRGGWCALCCKARTIALEKIKDGKA